MGIYIKNIEMPNSCMECPFKGFDRARGRGNICTINDSITFHAVLDGVDVKFVRIGDCPLVPVPPHGDLIDAGELADVFRGFIAMYDSRPFSLLDITRRNELQSALANIVNAPTIIPAEEDE